MTTTDVDDWLSNLRETLEAYEEQYGEPIEAMVVGKHDDRKYDDKEPLADENVILSREDGLRKVDQRYDSGYGGADCFPLYAWTKSRIFFVHEYDGATNINYVPRNPVAIEPDFGGQSPLMDEIRQTRRSS
jgi:hypothetical protein